MLKLAAILECNDPQQALGLIAATALAAREKRALGLEDLQAAALGVGGKIKSMAGDVWANPHARLGLLGAGVGAVANPLLNTVTRKKKRKGILTEALEGAALGGAGGAGASLLGAKVPALSEPSPVEKIAMPEFLGNFGKKIGEGAAAAVNPFKDMWENPHVRTGLIGAGLGAGAGALSSLLDRKKRKNMLSSMLTGGLLGGAVGTGGSLLFNRGEPAKTVPDDKQQAAGKAQEGYNQLGRLGFNTKGVQDVTGQLSRGEISEEQARDQIQSQRPGKMEQFKNVGSSVGQAFKSGHPGEALEHADVAGLKAMTPFSGHFNEGTAALAVGGNIAGRSLANPEGTLRSYYDKATGFIGDKIRDSKSDFGPLAAWRKSLHAKDHALITGEINRPDVKDLHTFDPSTFSSDPGKQQLLNMARTSGTARTGPAANPVNPEIPTLDPRVVPGAGPKSPLSGNLLRPSKITEVPVGEKGQTIQLPESIHRKDLKNWAQRQQKGRMVATYQEGLKNRGRLGRITGGLLPGAMGLAPLLINEWGSGGFRSGAEPAEDILAANKILSKE